MEGVHFLDRLIMCSIVWI